MEKNPNSYHTLARPSEKVLFTDKKSKFYGFAFPINDRDEVKPRIEGLRHQFPKANHVCYAWQLGTEQVQYRTNDDGEPRNSAGAPIYGQIQSFGVTNILVAVVRIYGGTQLGIGGLIHAYRTAARMTLDTSVIIEKRLKLHWELNFDYPSLSQVMRTIKRHKLEINSQKLEMDCILKVQVTPSEAKKVKGELEGIRGLLLKELN